MASSDVIVEAPGEGPMGGGNPRSLGYFLSASWRLLTEDAKRVVRKTMWQLLVARLVGGIALILMARQSGVLTQALMQSSPWLTAFCVFVGLTLLRVPLDYFQGYWADALREG